MSEQQYQVQKILKKKTSKYGTLYYVKWLNYPQQQCTWEPQRDLKNSQDAIKQFQKKARLKRVKTTVVSSINKDPLEYRQIIQKNQRYIQILEDKAQQLLQIRPSVLQKSYNIEDMKPIPYDQIDKLQPIKNSQQIIKNKTKVNNNERTTKAKVTILKPSIFDGQHLIKYEINNKKYISQYDIVKKYRPLQLLQFYEKNFNLYTKKEQKRQRK